MGVAEAVHVHRFDADAGAGVASVAGADAVACVFFAVAPLVQGEVLAAHFGFVSSGGNNCRLWSVGSFRRGWGVIR